MSAKYNSRGDTIDHTPSSPVTVGAIVQVGGLNGLATEPIAANTLGALVVEGVIEVNIKDAETFSDGDAVYVDSSEATDSGRFLGYAVGASGSGVVRVKLVQSAPESGS